MKTHRRRSLALVGLLLGTAVAVVSAAAGSHSRIISAPAPAPAPALRQTSFFIPIEVRLRKLHLVRPDLINYPLAYEVHC